VRPIRGLLIKILIPACRIEPNGGILGKQGGEGKVVSGEGEVGAHGRPFRLAPGPLANGVWVFARGGQPIRRQISGRGHCRRVPSLQPTRGGENQKVPRTWLRPQTSAPGPRRKRPNRRSGRGCGGPRLAVPEARWDTTVRSAAGSSRPACRQTGHVALRRFDEGNHLHLTATLRTSQGVASCQIAPGARVGHIDRRSNRQGQLRPSATSAWRGRTPQSAFRQSIVNVPAVKRFGAMRRLRRAAPTVSGSGRSGMDGC